MDAFSLGVFAWIQRTPCVDGFLNIPSVIAKGNNVNKD